MAGGDTLDYGGGRQLADPPYKVGHPDSPPNRAGRGLGRFHGPVQPPGPFAKSMLGQDNEDSCSCCCHYHGPVRPLAGAPSPPWPPAPAPTGECPPGGGGAPTPSTAPGRARADGGITVAVRGPGSRRGSRADGGWSTDGWWRDIYAGADMEVGGCIYGGGYTGMYPRIYFGPPHPNHPSPFHRRHGRAPSHLALESRPRPGGPPPCPANWRVLRPRPRAPSHGAPPRVPPTGKLCGPGPLAAGPANWPPPPGGLEPRRWSLVVLGCFPLFR